MQQMIQFRTTNLSYTSTSFGQVERSHSTIRELARCLLKENPELDAYNLIQTAVYKYNNTFYSFVKNTPHNIYIGERRELNFNELQRLRDQTYEKVLKIFKEKDASIQQDKQYPTNDPNTTVYEKTKEISKRRSRNKPSIVKENHHTFIIDVIPLGEAKLQQGYIRILHPINTSEIKNLIEQIHRQINHDNHCTPMHQLLIVKQQILYDTYMKLTPIVNTPTHNRNKRWDTVGTIFKWIAGTPDADDLRLINSSMNSLINETN